MESHCVLQTSVKDTGTRILYSTLTSVVALLVDHLLPTLPQLILFLNKCDLLQAKLQRGVQIRDSVPSFGDRKNDLSTATRCWYPLNH